MGHAGAIISGSAGTAQAKKEALEKVGVRVGRTPSETAVLVREVMQDAPLTCIAGATLRAAPSAGAAHAAAAARLHGGRGCLPGWAAVTASAPPSARRATAPGHRPAVAARPGRWPSPGRSPPAPPRAPGWSDLTLLVLAGWIAAPHAGLGLPGVLRTAADAVAGRPPRRLHAARRGPDRHAPARPGAAARRAALAGRAGGWSRTGEVSRLARGRLRGAGAGRAVRAAGRGARPRRPVVAGHPVARRRRCWPASCSRWSRAAWAARGRWRPWWHLAAPAAARGPAPWSSARSAR